MSELDKPSLNEDFATAEPEDHDLSDMLQELRILLQGSQVLTAFLIVLPFNQGFAKIDQTEKLVYLATFLSSISGLVMFSAPAAFHRLARPIVNKERFKSFSTRMIIIGLAFLTLALVLVSQLVVAEVAGFEISLVVAGFVAILILGIWWALPLSRKGRL